MLLGDQDREELLELLSRHAALGRLELDELERRVERVLEAQTREDAVTVLHDLPPFPASEQRRGHLSTRGGHGHVDRPKVDWTPTEERFRDPGSARIMRVWTDAAGGRHYVPEQ
jgi:hypothetical protein